MNLPFTGENAGCRFLKEVISTSEFLGDATLGSYTSDDRIPKWNSINVFEESNIEKNAILLTLTFTIGVLLQILQIAY